MSTITKCDKCIFADYHDSDEPCALGIIEKIKNIKTIEKTENNFAKILHYKCPFAFSAEIYQQNIKTIGTVDDLKQYLFNRTVIDYYMVIIVDDTNNISKICQSISSITIKPKFISLVLKQNNNTQNIINNIRKDMPNDIKWKLHNLLDDYNFQDILDTIFATSVEKSDITYFWINNDTKSIKEWDRNIVNINSIITIEQPFAHAFFRKGIDGLFLTFDNYQQILEHYKTNILESLEKIENKSIIYYG